MAKKGNGNSVVNLGAGAVREIIDINKKILGAKIGSALTGGSIRGAAAGMSAMTKKKGK
jgi:hypothetical protein